MKSLRPAQQALAIIERYEHFLNYIYPVYIGIRRAHYIIRDQAIAAALRQPSLFVDAAKSGQASKLYAADAGLATLRFHLRFLADPARKLISRRQHEVASVHLAEVGKMLGGWIKGSAKGAGG